MALSRAPVHAATFRMACEYSILALSGHLTESFQFGEQLKLSVSKDTAQALLAHGLQVLHLVRSPWIRLKLEEHTIDKKSRRHKRRSLRQIYLD